MAHLFDTFTLRGLTLRNRIVVSPMCEIRASTVFRTIGMWSISEAAPLGARDS